MSSKGEKIKEKYNNLYFKINFTLLLLALLNMILISKKTFIIMILITISAIINECLYMIFGRKKGINPNIYKDYQNMIYWSFAMVDIGLLASIIACIYYIFK